MASFMFGGPMQMVPQKPKLALFGGVYEFTVESAAHAGGFQYITATIGLNPKVKVLPENIDNFPDLLDVYELCDGTSIVEFLLSILFDGVIDPYYTTKEVHIREDNGFILIQARVGNILMCPTPIDSANSYSNQRVVQRIGKSEFFLSGQEYDFPTQCTEMGVITVSHSSLSKSDNWHGFKDPRVDWIAIYREFIDGMEIALHQSFLRTNAEPDILDKYATFATVYETNIVSDQLTVRMVTWPKSMLGTDVMFPTDDVNGFLVKIPPDGTDPLQFWRQVSGNLHPGLIPLLVTCDGSKTINGNDYLYLRLDDEQYEISNAWALHHQHTSRPNVMKFFPEAGLTNTVDMTVKVKPDKTYHFNATFFPFLQNSSALAILNSGNPDYPHVIGVLECEFTEILEDPYLFTAAFVDPSKTFLYGQFIAELNQWIGLPKDEEWVLLNYVADPNHRFYQVLTKHSPQGMQPMRSKSAESSEPVSNDKDPQDESKKKRWKLW